MYSFFMWCEEIWPPSSPVQDLRLQGLVARVEASLVNVETMGVEYTFIQRCTFPVKELLGKTEDT